MPSMFARVLLFTSAYLLLCIRLSCASSVSFELAKAIQPTSSSAPSSNTQPQTLSEYENAQFFWYTPNCTVGYSTGLNLLVDTGSADLILNPNIYKPSPSSLTHNPSNFSLTYGSPTKSRPGFLTVNGSTFYDKATVGSLSVSKQVIGTATSYSYTPPNPRASKPYAGNIDGIVGLLGQPANAIANSVPFVANLFKTGAISQYRFGTAYGTDKRGRQIVGGVDPSLYSGALTVTQRQKGGEVFADIAVNDNITHTNQEISIDTGTAYVSGPIDIVKDIYYLLDLPTTHHTINTTFGPIQVLYGHYPCSTPPSFGFSIPSQSQLADRKTLPVTISKKAKTFDLLPAVWPLRKPDGGNCTAILIGTDQFGPLWVAGQPFFQGHYVDDDRGAGTMGFAVLKDTENVGLTRD